MFSFCLSKIINKALCRSWTLQDEIQAVCKCVYNFDFSGILYRIHVASGTLDPTVEKTFPRDYFLK